VEENIAKWSVGDEVKLRDLAEKSLTAREIGEMMGISRNAIIGKMRRMGIPLHGARGFPREPRKTAVRRSPMTRKPSANGSPKERKAILRPSMWGHPPATPIVPANNGRGITLLQLSHRNCHTVIGSTRPQKGLPRYCGRQSWNDTQYCEEHYAAFHRPPQYRR